MTTAATDAATDPRAGRRCNSALNSLHSTHYFSPDLGRELGALGVTDPRAVNFAVRAAALGPVGAGAVTAAFYNYKHDLVARHVPAVWETVTPGQALAARTRAVDATLRRLLGEEVLASAEMAEAAGLALRAAEACSRSARPLYAAHADLPVPEAPHLALWHAATLLREHRGDGHLAALLTAGLDGLEALVTHTATGKGISPKWIFTTRGWTQEEWDTATDRLRERGLVDGAGELTGEGSALRAEVERQTDRLDAAPYAHLGPEGVARLTELATGFVRTALGAGAFPPDLLGKG
ncbi:SCO6745 family protein [Streptomyces sp. enrichment culture]|uniref:SCO6745 family protein n=1 Tax=Streptomyces sp. enrichment culture TaxID=1795815 RepID=UPI003F566038